MKQRVIVVLGMHRNGTSAVTRGLQALGVELGSRMVPAAADNPKGFWEHQGMVNVNRRLLDTLRVGCPGTPARLFHPPNGKARS